MREKKGERGKERRECELITRGWRERWREEKSSEGVRERQTYLDPWTCLAVIYWRVKRKKSVI